MIFRTYLKKEWRLWPETFCNLGLMGPVGQPCAWSLQSILPTCISLTQSLQRPLPPLPPWLFESTKGALVGPC